MLEGAGGGGCVKVQKCTNAIHCRSGKFFFQSNEFFVVDEDSGLSAIGSVASGLNFYVNCGRSPLAV